MVYTINRRATGPFEYTSTSSRFTNFVIKWIEYALTKHMRYAIVESAAVSPDVKARVVIGCRYPFEGASRSPTGDPLEGAEHELDKQIEEGSGNEGSGGDVYKHAEECAGKVYSERVYEDTEVENFPILDKLVLSAKNYSSHRRLRKRCTEVLADKKRIEDQKAKEAQLNKDALTRTKDALTSKTREAERSKSRGQRITLERRIKRYESKLDDLATKKKDKKEEIYKEKGKARQSRSTLKTLEAELD